MFFKDLFKLFLQEKGRERDNYFDLQSVNKHKYFQKQGVSLQKIMKLKLKTTGIQI
jgi:hypothetical protein